MKNWKYIEGAKTGNAGITDKEFNSENDLRRWCIEHNYTYTPVGGGYYRLEDDSGKNRRDLEAHVKAGNKKVGNETLHEYATSKPRVINEDKTGAEEFFKQLSDDVKEREDKDDEEIEKVGNRVIEKESEMSQELKNLLKKAPEWIKEKIQYAFSHGFTIDEKDFINAIKKEVGNSKVGNAKDKNGKDLRVGDIVLVWTSAGERAGKVKEVSGDRITVAIRNEGDWSTPGKLADKVSNSKTGNEAPDDKFAYVMREFDEGKLKTPDGKVVTDPAQAKAIAYSESKKTENGLARARNAMAGNKKVKNSAVREYKHSDGRVAQIDFNEDGTDADMSIYEGTKEIEQRNFSTIRDAEQYVTSHGFRRI